MADWIEIGKRYVLSNGTITAPIERTSPFSAFGDTHPFCAKTGPKTNTLWTRDGVNLGDSDLNIMDGVDEMPETVAEFIARNKVKFGDELTDGAHTWKYTKYIQRQSHLGYLSPMRSGGRNVNGSCIVSGGSLGVVHIPNLKRKPQTVRVYKWVVKFLDVAQPVVSEQHYPNEAQLHAAYKSNIQWVARLDQCHEDKEVECDC